MTERYKFEVKFKMKYSYDKSRHKIAFEIMFRDHPGSFREYFKNFDFVFWKKIWRNPSLTGLFMLIQRDTMWKKPIPYIDTRQEFVLGYESTSEEDPEGRYTFADDEWKNIKRDFFISIYANWDNSLVPAMDYAMRNNKVSPNMVDDFYKMFYDELKKAMFGNRGFHQNLKTLVQEDTNIVFTVDVPIQDRCNVQKLVSYKARPLVNDKNPSVSAITYTFKDDGKTFVVQYFYKHKEARVRSIICDDSNEKCKSFWHDLFQDNPNHKIVGHWFDDTIEIDLVYLGDARGYGHCTKAVSYMLKVLLLESAKKKCYPYIGRVYISSELPCSAVNCYSHAFINNGFLPNNAELDDFMSHTLDDIDDDGYTEYGFDFTFKDFISKEQKKKYEREEERKNSVASRTRGAKRKRINPFQPYLKF